MDEFKQGFEEFMKEQNTSVDLNISLSNGFYIDPGVQTAWIGYQVLHSGLSACADDSGVNIEEHNDDSDG